MTSSGKPKPAPYLTKAFTALVDDDRDASGEEAKSQSHAGYSAADEGDIDVGPWPAHRSHAGCEWGRCRSWKVTNAGTFKNAARMVIIAYPEV